MKEIEIGKHTVEIYDSIDELPIKRFHKFNKYLLIDAGVGSDLNSISEKINRIVRFIDKEDKANAKIELDNLRQAMFLSVSELNAKHLAFMALVKSVDGKDIIDLSDAGLKKTQQIFEEQQTNFIDRLIQSVKKKIDEELNLYFPSQFDSAPAKEFHDLLRSRVIYQLDSIINGVDRAHEIENADDHLITFSSPKIFSGKSSAEISYDKQFEDMCIFLAHELSIDADKMSVLQFYNSFDYIKKQQKKNGR